MQILGIIGRIDSPLAQDGAAALIIDNKKVILSPGISIQMELNGNNFVVLLGTIANRQRPTNHLRMGGSFLHQMYLI